MATRDTVRIFTYNKEIKIKVMKAIKKSEIKVSEVYQFDVVKDGGAGSGSQMFYSTTGKVKEVNAEFIRVFKSNGSKQSYKIYNSDITAVSTL